MSARPLLILDLDETLVSTVSSALFETLPISSQRMLYSLVDVEMDAPRGSQKFVVFKRPFVETFLNYMARFYRLALWSAGAYPYVRAVVENVLRPHMHEPFEFVWSEQHCDNAADFRAADRFPNQRYVKNLESTGENLARTLLVDNSRGNAALQLTNHIGVPDFNVRESGAWRDNWLPELAEFLEQLSGVRDVREINKGWWMTRAPASLVGIQLTVAALTTPPLRIMPKAKSAPHLSVTAMRNWRNKRHHKRRSPLWIAHSAVSVSD